jgi:4-hydroxybenzoate polyprenyltransferase
MNRITNPDTHPVPPATLGGTIRSYLELIRFSHTIFALPFAVLASAWAWKLTLQESDLPPISSSQVIGILVCMVAARSFAMSFNRLVDARFDAANPRTAGRHLPSGRLSYRGVAWFSLASAGVFVAGTLLFLPNALPWILSIPVLAFLAGYSLAKRFTVLVHFWLGIALGLAPICAWIALRGERVMTNPRDILPAGLVGLGVLFWVAGFDLIYSTQDAMIDRELGLRSLPSRLGVEGALRVAAICHAFMLLPFGLIPWLCPELGLGRVYWVALAIVAILLVYEHSIVSSNNLARVNVAFFQANAIISCLVLTAGVLDACWLN